MGEYTVRVGVGVRCWRVGKEEGGGRFWAWRKSIHRGGLCCVATAGERGRLGKRSQRGSRRNGSEMPEYPDRQSRLHSTGVAVRPWRPLPAPGQEFLPSQTLAPGAGALWLPLPSAQSQAVPLRGFSPHFIRRVTQARVHMI